MHLEEENAKFDQKKAEKNSPCYAFYLCWSSQPVHETVGDARPSRPRVDVRTLLQILYIIDIRNRYKY